jgi:TPP-dependent pyruvate/acetoin dehydrogenase alpha subunit
MTAERVDLAVTQGVPPELESYRSMLRIRRLEERVAALRAAETIVGSVHLCIGQEAIAVGALCALRHDDPVFATSRGHGWGARVRRDAA